MNKNPVRDVVKHFGSRDKVASITGVTYMAVKKWEKRGYFPRTDYTGETTYAQKLATASQGVFSESELLPKYQG